MRFARGRGNPLVSQPIARIVGHGSGTEPSHEAAEKRSLQVFNSLAFCKQLFIVNIAMTKYPTRKEPIASRLDPAEHRIFMTLCRTLKQRPSEVIRLGIKALAENEGLINREDVEARKDAAK